MVYPQLLSFLSSLGLPQQTLATLDCFSPQPFLPNHCLSSLSTFKQIMETLVMFPPEEFLPHYCHLSLVYLFIL